MKMMNNEPILSERFDLDDIRKLREYNAGRYMTMSVQEIVEETRAGAAEVLEFLGPRNHIKL